MAVITVSKQYASGGVELARRLARELGYRYLDKALLDKVADQMGVSPGEAEMLHQVDGGRLLTLIDKLSAAVIRGVAAQDPAELKVGRLNRADFIEQVKKMIHLLADEDNLVLVGWGGQLILRDHPQAVHIRTVAADKDRLNRVMEREKVERAAAEEIMNRRNHRSQLFIEHYWKRDWADPLLYDAVLNLSWLSVEGGSQTAQALMKIKGLG